MNNRESIYELYVNQYNYMLGIEKIKDANYKPQESEVASWVNIIEEELKKNIPNAILTEEEKNHVINRIKSIVSTFQSEGDALLGDSDHDYQWYDNYLNNTKEQYYWHRYKNYLATQSKWAPDVLDKLENDTLKKIMSYVGNPNDIEHSFSVRGLVVGDVQSGKTSNYIGLITKAADAGYKVIIVLTGTIESLRRQTQERIEEGFVGYDSTNAKYVGVGDGKKMPKVFTSRLKDFVAGDDQNTNIKIENYPSEPMLFVLKKNVSVLRKLYTSLKKINTKHDKEKINTSLILIDDEADNASINTNKPDNDYTKINDYIRKILNLFTRNSYVGFTATPFANVFIGYSSDDEMLKDDLFPRDFIYSLKAPSNYCGARTYFFEKNNNVRYIEDNDEIIFPMKHKKDWSGDKLFKSVYEAINTFLIANAIRDLRDVNKNIHTHRSMLINMSRFTNVQEVIKDIVSEYYSNVKRAIKQTHKLDINEALSNNYIKSLKETFDKEYSEIVINGELINWNDVMKVLCEAIKDIKIVVVNSSRKSEKLDYEKYETMGLRVIAIGGLALSRGLTLEGLCVSYFYRSTATFDVLMQMGRWFGYRKGYEDLCKIFITQESANYYKYICESIEELRKDIKEMSIKNKKPEDYGIRVRNDSVDLGITAPNKSRNTIQRIYRKSFNGHIFETSYLNANLSENESNVENTLEFLKNITLTQKDETVHHPYFRNVSKNNVIQLLNKLNIKENDYFDKKQILAYLKNEKSELDKFDVLIMGGSKKGTKYFEYSPLKINIPLVLRQFDLPDEDESRIRMSRQRTRLGGSNDTKYGLNTSQIPTGANKASDYLVKGRNPLLIIYFVYPDNNNVDAAERFAGVSTKERENEYVARVNASKYKYLVGFAIGFAKTDDGEGEDISYTVNKTVNYYDKNHDEEDIDE